MRRRRDISPRINKLLENLVLPLRHLLALMTSCSLLANKAWWSSLILSRQEIEARACLSSRATTNSFHRKRLLQGLAKCPTNRLVKEPPLLETLTLGPTWSQLYQSRECLHQGAIHSLLRRHQARIQGGRKKILRATSTTPRQRIVVWVRAGSTGLTLPARSLRSRLCTIHFVILALHLMLQACGRTLRKRYLQLVQMSRRRSKIYI